MNARQKAKHYKKKLQELYDDYVASAIRCGELVDAVTGKIERVESQKAVCSVEKRFSEPVEIDEYIAIDMWEQLTYDPNFRQAVVFDGRTDPDTGRYILEAKLTVVMPEEE